ncbi:MAG: Mrp/NBP35 family ATP-binding protein [Mycobacteriales bacterium]
MPPTSQAVTAALATVLDPEIHKPITELGMVRSVEVSPSGAVTVVVALTTAGCPLRERIERDVRAALAQVNEVTAVSVRLEVMTDEQRAGLREQLHGPGREVPFVKPGSLTRLYAIASGKGGVGKSSVTANLAAAMARDGLRVGVLDADIYGHSLPRMLGVTNRPTVIDRMIIPPEAHGVRVISVGMFIEGNTPVVWRGPMLHRAVEQFLTDVHWGDLDVLLLDLPPGTGDVAISVAQLIPGTEILVVTTPQLAAREVAERAGAIATQTRQHVAGVIENMSGLDCPECGHHLDLFGVGGGAEVAAALTAILGAEVPLLGSVPLEPRLRAGGDSGRPLVIDAPDTPAAVALNAIAKDLARRSRGLVGRPLGLTPVRSA